MVALAHIKKFVEEHPKYFDVEEKERVLTQAESLARSAKAGTINSGRVEELLGNKIASELFILVMNDREYKRIPVDARGN